MKLLKYKKTGELIETFKKLNLSSLLIKAIKDLNYQNPTKIQNRVIPNVLKGYDIIASSKSGTGKTAAYVLPMVNKILEINHKKHVLRGLILVPTRELVEQVSKVISDFTKYTKIKHFKISGGVNKKEQQKDNLNVDIIIATPGRLIELVKDGFISLESVNIIVLDEADALLEMGFKSEIESILKFCSLYRQILIFSATISQNVKKLAKKYVKNLVSIEISNRRDCVVLIKHKIYKVDIKKKPQLLAYIIKRKSLDSILVFANTKQKVDLIYDYLKIHNIEVVKLHSDMNYKDRVRSIKLFKAKKSKVLVATDIISRGLDIQDLPLVINYELPQSIDDFTHRVGRTGRANKHGESIILLDINDYAFMNEIERKLRLSIKREIQKGFELTDKEPRQNRPKKLKEKKLKTKKIDQNIKKVKSKKTTKRDENRIFRKR